jgi:hypothetical protein
MRFVVPLLWLFTLYILPLVSTCALIAGVRIAYRVGALWCSGQRASWTAIGLAMLLVSVAGWGFYFVGRAILTVATSGH